MLKKLFKRGKKIEAIDQFDEQADDLEFVDTWQEDPNLEDNINYDGDPIYQNSFEIDDETTEFIQEDNDAEYAYQRRAKYHTKMDRFLTNGIIIVGVLLVAVLLVAFLV